MISEKFCVIFFQWKFAFIKHIFVNVYLSIYQYQHISTAQAERTEDPH